MPQHQAGRVKQDKREALRDAHILLVALSLFLVTLSGAGLELRPLAQRRLRRGRVDDLAHLVRNVLRHEHVNMMGTCRRREPLRVIRGRELCAILGLPRRGLGELWNRDARSMRLASARSKTYRGLARRLGMNR